MGTSQPKTNKKAFGQRLKFLRKLEQLTQAQLSEAVGVTVEHLSNLERGASAPSFDMIIKLAEALGTQPAGLFLFTPFQLLEEQSESAPHRDPGTLDWRGYVSRVGVFERDLATDTSRWSGSFHEILGLPPGLHEMGYQAIRGCTLEEDRRSLDAANQRLEQGFSPQAITFRFRRKDGTVRLGLIHAEVERDEFGQPAKAFGVFMDITEQKRFEQSLEATHQIMEQRVAERTRELKDTVRRLEREQEERARTEHLLTRTSRELGLVLDTITDGYFDQDLVTGKAYYSPSWGRMLGYEPEELKPDRTTWRELIHPEDLELVENRFQQQKLERGPLRLKSEFRLKAKDGAWRWILSQSQVLDWDENGEPSRLVGTHTDITELRAALAALETNEHLLLKAQELARMGNWEIDLETNACTWSDQIYRMLGLEPGEIEVEPPTLGTYLHPEDYAEAREQLDHTLATHEPYRCEKRLVRKDGQVIHTLGVAEYLPDDGRAGRLVGIIQDITESKQAEIFRLKAEQRYRLLAEHSADVIWTMDANHKLTYVSPSCTRVYGYTEDEMTSMPLSGRYTEKSWNLVQQTLAERFTEKDGRPPANEPCLLELEHVRKDGSHGWVEVHTTPLFTSEGTFIGLVGLSREITQRKAADLTLKKSQAVLSRAQELARMGNWEIDLDTRECIWSEQIFRLLGMEPGEIEVHPTTLAEFTHPDDMECASQSLERAMVEHLPCRCELRMFRKDGEMIYTVGAAEIVCDESGRSRGLLGVLQDVTEIKRAEMERLEAEQRYRLLAEHSADVIWTMDPEARLTYLSPSCERIYGYTEEEILGMPNEQRFTPESVAQIKQTVRERKAEIKSGNRSSDPYRLELEYISKAGRHGWIEVHSTPLFSEEGTFVGVIGTSRDITQRKQAEDALKKSEAVLTRAQELAGLGNWEFDPLRRQGWWSDNTYRLYGYEPDEADASYTFFLDHLHPDDLEATRKRHAALLESGDTLRHEYRFLRKDGSIRHAQSWVEVARDENGRAVLMSGTIQDITEYRAALDDLEESRAVLQRSHELAGMGNWKSDWASGIEWWSDNLYRLNGYEPGEIQPDRELFLNSLHPEDRDRVLAQLQDFLEQGEHLCHDYRIALRNGESRHIQSWVEVQRDVDGKPLTLSGTVQDITELKQAEAELRESEARFRRLAENAPDIIFRMRVPDGQYDYISPACQAITGYTAEEVLAVPMFVATVMHPDWRDYLARQWEQICSGQGPEVSEYDIIDKFGRVRRLNQRNVYVYDEQGRVVALEGMATDVTERSNAEQALRASEERYQRMFVQAALAMAFCNPDGVLLEVNETFARLVGYQRRELLGMSAMELTHPDDRKASLRLLGKVSAGEVVRFQMDMRHLRKDGLAVQSRVYVQSLQDGEGRLLGIMAHIVALDETLEEI